MDTYIVAIVLIVAVMVYKLVNETVTQVTKERTKRVKEERKILELKVELERLKHQPPVDEPAAPLQEVEQGKDQRDGDQTQEGRNAHHDRGRAAIALSLQGEENH